MISNKNKSKLNINQVLLYCFFICILVSSLFVRLSSVSEYSLGSDEVVHLNYSNYLGLKDFFKKAYGEVHPPLHYILMNIAYRIHPSIQSIRMPALIFGILLVIVTFFVLKKHTSNNIAIIYGTFVIAFGYQYVSLSQGTRTYSLTFFWFVLQFNFFLELLKQYRQEHFIKFIFLGFLAIFSDYCCLTSILAMNTTIIYRHRKIFSFKNYALIFSQILFMGAQLLLVKKYSHLDVTTMDYLDINIGGFSTLIERLISILSRGFFSLDGIRFLVLLMIILGIWYLVSNKNDNSRYILLNLFITVIFLFGAHFAHLYPFTDERHSLIISTLFLLSAAVAIRSSLYTNVFLSFSIIFISFVYTHDFRMKKDCGQIRNKSYINLGYRKTDLEFVLNFLKEIKSTKKDVVIMNLWLPTFKFNDEEEKIKEKITALGTIIKRSMNLNSKQTKDSEQMKIMKSAERIICVDCLHYPIFKTIKNNFKIINKQNMCEDRDILLLERIK